MEEWSGSSIDGSLDDNEELNSSNVIVGEVVEMQRYEEHVERNIEYTTKTSTKMFEHNFVTGREENAEILPKNAVEHDEDERSFVEVSSPSQRSEDYVQMLIPSCQRLNEILQKSGYSCIDLNVSDIDVNRRSMSVFVIDAWAESVCTSVGELMDQQLSTQANASAVSFDMGRSEASQDVLQAEVSRLQEKLEASVRRERAAEQKRENAGAR